MHFIFFQIWIVKSPTKRLLQIQEIYMAQYNHSLSQFNRKWVRLMSAPSAFELINPLFHYTRQKFVKI